MGYPYRPVELLLATPSSTPSGRGVAGKNGHVSPIGVSTADNPARAVQSAGPPRNCGLRGTTVVDQGSPLWGVGPQSYESFPARLRITWAGAEIAQVSTGLDGIFSIPLPPGRYTINGENLTGLPVPTFLPTDVEIRPQTFTTIVVQFDSGVR